MMGPRMARIDANEKQLSKLRPGKCDTFEFEFGVSAKVDE